MSMTQWTRRQFGHRLISENPRLRPEHLNRRLVGEDAHDVLPGVRRAVLAAALDFDAMRAL